MLPSVSPTRSSRSWGVKSSQSLTDFLKFGAYSSMTSIRCSPVSSRNSSQVPCFGLTGAYSTQIDITCLPSGTSDLSNTDGI